jgi:hypothetical protein
MGKIIWFRGNLISNQDVIVQNFWISWDVFIGGLRKILLQIKSEEEQVLKYILGKMHDLN